MIKLKIKKQNIAKLKAVEMGEKLKQISIFNWATKSCINLK